MATAGPNEADISIVDCTLRTPGLLGLRGWGASLGSVLYWSKLPTTLQQKWDGRRLSYLDSWSLCRKGVYGNFLCFNSCLHLSMSNPKPRLTLSAEDIQRLRDVYLGSFREANRSRRMVVVKEAFKTLMESKEGHFSQGSRSAFKQVWYILSATVCTKGNEAQSVKEWLYNRGRKRTVNDKVRYLRKWTLKHVVGHVRKEEVDRACREKSGEKSGATTYLANYQKVLRGIVDGLPDDEREQYEQQASEWNQSSPPIEMQRKWVLPEMTLRLH